MLLLLLGLLLFFIPHSVSIYARQLRSEKISQLGRPAWLGLYSVVSLAGLVLISWGYAQTRVTPVFIWHPPEFLRHVTAVLMIIASVLFVAGLLPHNTIKSFFGHPMVLSVKVWAVAHLLSNGRLGDIILFGAFLVWAVVLYISCKRHDRLVANQATAGSSGAGFSGGLSVYSIVPVLAGLVFWFVITLYLHVRLIGVSPFG